MRTRMICSYPNSRVGADCVIRMPRQGSKTMRLPPPLSSTQPNPTLSLPLAYITSKPVDDPPPPPPPPPPLPQPPTPPVPFPRPVQVGGCLLPPTAPRPTIPFLFFSYVKSFRDPSKLLSEAGYVLTQLVSAVCFLEEVDASVLSIAHGDFERGLKGFQETAIVGLRAHQQEARVLSYTCYTLVYI